MKTIIKILCLLLWLPTLTTATPFNEQNIPEPLKPWVDWVLHDTQEQQCSHAYNSQTYYCTWPTRLYLELNDQQGHFQQFWYLEQEAWIRLPGDNKYWPLSVNVNNNPATVTLHKGYPSVHLPTGEHFIQGKFKWDKLPESLTIPPETALIQVNRNGETLNFPKINQDNQLWLDRQLQEKNVQDTLDIQVFRKLIDAHPLQVETRIQLNVSGNPRDIELSAALLKDFIPLRLNSKLPARITPKGHLRIQLRPGEWTITLVARAKANLTTLPTIADDKSWPKQELWVFAANPSLRLVEIAGVTGIDARQTRLPSDWQAHPAYLVNHGEHITLNILQRGSAEPEPNNLNLTRKLWLDFDGQGYTLNDTINGRMTRGWRLETDATIELGQVSMNGQAQFITRLPDSEQQGIEVRHGTINLKADSRYSQTISTLPVTGWQHDFRQVNTTLYLPAGWKLFSAHGMDNIPNTWLQRWTLLDLFLLLITAVAMARLWRWQWGLFALITLALIWHEPDAPKFIWLNLIAIIALLRVLPKASWPQKLLLGYRNFSVVILLLIMIPFVIDQVRYGLYPQLDQGEIYDSPNTHAPILGVMNMESAKEEAEADYAQSIISSQRLEQHIPQYTPKNQKLYDKSERKKSKKNVLNEIDPNATIQTGPGLPIWDWDSVYFSWNGPVTQTQQLHLNLISPTANLILNALRILLVIILGGLLIRYMLREQTLNTPKNDDNKPSQTKLQNNLAAVLVLPLLAMLWFTSPSVQADIPDQAVLDQLKERLLEPAECLPNCAQIENMHITLNANNALMRLRVHNQSQSAIPLPGNAKQWLPTQVFVNEAPAQNLRRDSQGELWLALPAGIHEVVLQGLIAHRPQIQLPLPLLPHRVEWQAQGWLVEGIREDQRPEKQLQLIRQQSTETASEMLNESSVLPPLLHVSRTVHLGLDGTVDTEVVRLSPSGNPISLSIPLLNGESVLSSAYTVKNGHIKLNFSANQNSLQWHSRLNIRDELVLKAAENTGFVETWKVDASPVWHLDISGIPTLHQQQQDGAWLPEWKPWPGETVRLNVSRPIGIEGQSLTIDRSILDVTQSKRASESRLQLTLRSSQGGQHSLTLPENAELQSVSIKGKIQPVRQQERTIILPISPGKQSIEIVWREPREITTSLDVSPLNLGVSSVNNSIKLSLSQDRWVLWTQGPQMGPAVLFWGVLIVILIGSILLGRLKNTPLKSWHWFLLGIGLTQASVEMIIVVVAWLIVLAQRPRFAEIKQNGLFNLMQLGIVGLTFIALASLLFAVTDGLLGSPNMQIAGNGSSAHYLHWFQDRIGAELPQPLVISVPLLAYRILMLLWALWLAFALLNWLRWGWDNFTVGGLWRKSIKKDKPAEQPSKQSTSETTIQQATSKD